MRDRFVEFDMIQRAIHHTQRVITENACHEIEIAKEQYLMALSHETLVEAQYLKYIIE
jgi:hypothetical protein